MSYRINNTVSSNFVAIWGQLHNELVYLRENDIFKTDIGKRTYIKSFITLVEGLAYALRQHILSDDKIKLNPEDSIVLKEIKFDIQENGEVKSFDQQFKSINLFKFTFKTYGTYYNKIDVITTKLAENGFSQLQETYKKRNRLTHPKDASELNITEYELETANKAHQWFHDFINQAFDGVLTTKAS